MVRTAANGSALTTIYCQLLPCHRRCFPCAFRVLSARLSAVYGCETMRSGIRAKSYRSRAWCAGQRLSAAHQGWDVAQWRSCVTHRSKQRSKQVRDRMGTLNPETVDALNMLLEDVRASVEIEVALSNGATEYLEREALSQMGVEDTLIAFLLRDWLDALNLPVTRRINGIVLQALDLTRYDDRLQLFVHHQLASCDQARQLLEDGALDDVEGDGEGQAILRALADAHTRHAAWCEQRAREFAKTRLLDFRRPPHDPR